MHPGWRMYVTVSPSKVGNMRGWLAIDVLIWIGTQGLCSTPHSAPIFTGDDNTLICLPTHTHFLKKKKLDTLYCTTRKCFCCFYVHTCLKLCKMPAIHQCLCMLKRVDGWIVFVFVHYSGFTAAMLQNVHCCWSYKIYGSFSQKWNLHVFHMELIAHLLQRQYVISAASG